MADVQKKRSILMDALSTHTEEILGTIMVYLRRFGHCGPPGLLKNTALEVLSETTVTTLQSSLVDRFDPEIGVALAWIKKIAFNKTMGWVKRERKWDYRERGCEGTNERMNERMGASMDEMLSIFAARNLNLSSVADDVEMILDSLSPDDRRILSLHYIEGYSGKELAERLGINPGAAYVRLSRARQRAREIAIESR